MDASVCPTGIAKLITVITDPAVIVAFLGILGLPTRAPPLAPVRRGGRN